MLLGKIKYSIFSSFHKIERWLKALKILNSKKDVLKKVEQILLDKETIYKDEFEMLFNGASVEEVEDAIDKKEQEKKEYQEQAKKEALEEHKTRDIKTRVETAEALAKAGVISKQDLENIKKEAEREFEKINQQLASTEEKKEEVKDNVEKVEEEPSKKTKTKQDKDEK